MRNPTLKETEGDFRAQVARMVGGAPAENPRPAFDPKQAKEFRQEALQGRKEEAYVQALEFHGFKYFSDAQLAARGISPTGEGIWRHPVTRYALAFWPSDLPGNFTSPEAFDKWVRAHKLAVDLRGKVTKEERRIILAKS